MRLTVTAKNLLAALRIAPVRDVRYYLNGVCIEATSQETRVIASDGHMLVVMREDQSQDCEASVRLVIPRDAIESLCLTKKDAENAITLELTNGTWYIGAHGRRREFVPYDHQYVDYRKVIPSKPSGEVAQFSMKVLNTMHDALALHLNLNKNRGVEFGIEHNGNGAAIVNGGSASFVGIMMPFRIDAPLKPHQWAADKLRGHKENAAILKLVPATAGEA